MVIKRLLALISLCFLAVIALAPVSSYAQAAAHVISISDPGFSQQLGQGIAYLEDPTAQLSLQQVREIDRSGGFSHYQHDQFQQGYSDSAYWLKLSIANHLPQRIGQSDSDRFYLSVRYPLLDDLRFFHLRANKTDQYTVGDRLQFQQRLLKLNNFDYPISLQPGERSEVFIRVQTSSSLSVPLYLETEQAYVENQYRLNTLDGIYFGISIGLGVYNLFLWIGVRKKIYGLYVLLIVNLWLFNSSIIGFSYRLWPQAIEFQQVAIYLFSIAAAISMSVFGIAFLKTRLFQPTIHKVIIGLIVAYLAAIPALFFIPVLLAAKLNVAITVSGLIMLLIAAMRSYIRGYRPARYFLVGQGAVLFGVFFTVLTSLGIIPLYSLAPEIMKWATAFELVFFSFALADLFNDERQLREQAQLETSRAQEALLQSQIKLTAELDSQVQERTKELELANRRLQDLSKVDELTGLYNRRHMNEILPNEYRRAYREKTPISMLVFDIDFFKKINDSYGHAFGDLCLQQVAKVIDACLHRPADVAFRYGGEEFIILLPNTDMEGALCVASNVRKGISDLVVSDEEHSASMTMSVGIASQVPDDREDFEQLFKLADQRLYLAKTNGRDRIVASDELKPSLKAVD